MYWLNSLLTTQTKSYKKARKKFSELLPIFGIIFLISCSSSEPQPELSIESLSIYSDPDANDNSAIAVDLVLVYDFELMKILGQMSATKYFSATKQLLLDNPTLLEVWHWELVPGQIVDKFTPDQPNGDAFGAFVFANYLTPGDHRVKIAPDGVIKILLLKDDLRNFAALNSTDAKIGTTVTNNTPPEVRSEDDEVPYSKFKKGPVEDLSKPCKKVAPAAVTPKQVVCPPPPCAIPVKIKSRPLKPLPLLKPCLNKKIR